jgi:hypothetical protein
MELIKVNIKVFGKWICYFKWRSREYG